jgi:hypothetical protein
MDHGVLRFNSQMLVMCHLESHGHMNRGSVHFPNTLSILRMIRSAHWTAAATKYSVLGLGFESRRSSAVFKCRVTRIPATMASTRLRPSSIRDIVLCSPFVRLHSALPKGHTPAIGTFPIKSFLVSASLWVSVKGGGSSRHCNHQNQRSRRIILPRLSRQCCIPSVAGVREDGKIPLYLPWAFVTPFVARGLRM